MTALPVLVHGGLQYDMLQQYGHLLSVMIMPQK